MSAIARTGTRTNTTAVCSNPSTVSTANTGGGQSHSHNLTANYVGDSASILQPYLVLIYIIKT